MLRVTFVNRHPSDVIGGSELQCDLFARGLAARGHAVSYVALRSSARPSEGTLSLPYGLVRLAPDESQDPDSIARAIRGTAPDVVYWRHGRQSLDAVVALLDGPPRRIPVVLAVAHVDDVSRWPTGPVHRASPRTLAGDLRHRLEHRRTWRAFAEVAAIAAQREDFLGRTPVALQRHVPNVVDPSTVPFVWPRPYVAWVANLKSRKRPEQLVPLARALAPHHVDLVVAGALQDERYRGLTVSNSSIPNLHSVGALPPGEAAGLIAGARCLAVTARPEGLSNAMIQAWWHGVPTVSLDYDPDRAIASRGLGQVCGGDATEFRRATVELATSTPLRDAAGGRARDHARQRFDFATNVLLLEGLLGDTVSGVRQSRG